MGLAEWSGKFRRRKTFSVQSTWGKSPVFYSGHLDFVEYMFYNKSENMIENPAAKPSQKGSLWALTNYLPMM